MSETKHDHNHHDEGSQDIQINSNPPSLDTMNLKLKIVAKQENSLTEQQEQVGKTLVTSCSEEQSSIYDLPESAASVSKGVLRKLFIASAIAFVFLLIEAVGGILSGSLAILSDAAHMFSDISGFFISIMAIWIGTRPASKRLSFGYHRAEVIGALVSIALIWGLTVALVYEATTRIIEQSMVKDPLFMLCIAVFGLFSNLAMAKVLHSAPGHSHAGHNHEHESNHSHSNDHHHDHKTNTKSHSHEIQHNAKKAHTHSKHAHLDNDEEQQGHSHSHEKESQQTHDPHKHEKEVHKQHSHTHDSVATSCENHNSNRTNDIEKKNLSNIGEQENYNLRAAMIHVIGDVIQSVGVVIAALLIYLLGDSEQFDYWHLADPICTYLFSILVMFTTFRIVKDCVRVLMEGTPDDFDIQEFKEKLSRIEHVVEIHDLHIWSLSAGKPSMSVHILVEKGEGNKDAVLIASTEISRKNGIYHSTIQIEDISRKDTSGQIQCKHNIHY